MLRTQTTWPAGPIVTIADDQVRAPLEKTAKAIADPFRDFIDTQGASGQVLLTATAIAVAFANSPWASAYFDLVHLEFGLSLGVLELQMSLKHWVNDGLMAVFFFLLGLELKRELMVGQLNDLKGAAAVLCAAIGGMVVPALVFLSVAGQSEVQSGWAIPIATDTAFALMILVLLGNQVPRAARAFLVGLAIVDDLGAILVIALGYTSMLEASLLLPVAACTAALAGLNLAGIRGGGAYAITGLLLWILLTGAGLHGTLAGVIVALAAPVRPAISRHRFIDLVVDKLHRFVADDNSRRSQAASNILEQPRQQAIAQDVSRLAVEATAPLARWESRLDTPVSLVVMPTFAFMNAGVVLSGSAVAAAWSSELSHSILLGLTLGKPLGIVGGVAIGAWLGVAALPPTLGPRHLIGLGFLGGIGFTMSLFIATLSFGEGSELLEIAKQSIIATSAFIGVIAYAWLRWGCPPSHVNQDSRVCESSSA